MQGRAGSRRAPDALFVRIRGNPSLQPSFRVGLIKIKLKVKCYFLGARITYVNEPSRRE